MLPFDPIALRDFWLKVRLPYVMNAAPLNHEEPRVTHISRVSYAVVQASGFVNGYFVGLWNELLPKVEKHIRWMESEPEPEPSVYREHGLTEEGWRDEVFVWRQTLGLCKWLGRGDRAFSDLTAAAAADWQMLELASPALASQARATRCNFMSIHLATALAAGSPLIGLKIQEAAHMKSPMEPMTSPIRFGLWACQHLIMEPSYSRQQSGSRRSISIAAWCRRRSRPSSKRTTPCRAWRGQISCLPRALLHASYLDRTDQEPLEVSRLQPVETRQHHWIAPIVVGHEEGLRIGLQQVVACLVADLQHDRAAVLVQARQHLATVAPGARAVGRAFLDVRQRLRGTAKGGEGELASGHG